MFLIAGAIAALCVALLTGSAKAQDTSYQDQGVANCNTNDPNADPNCFDPYQPADSFQLTLESGEVITVPLYYWADPDCDTCVAVVYRSGDHWLYRDGRRFEGRPFARPSHVAFENFRKVNHIPSGQRIVKYQQPAPTSQTPQVLNGHAYQRAGVPITPSYGYTNTVPNGAVVHNHGVVQQGNGVVPNRVVVGQGQVVRQQPQPQPQHRCAPGQKNCY